MVSCSSFQFHWQNTKEALAYMRFRRKEIKPMGNKERKKTRDIPEPLSRGGRGRPSNLLHPTRKKDTCRHLVDFGSVRKEGMWLSIKWCIWAFLITLWPYLIADWRLHPLQPQEGMTVRVLEGQERELLLMTSWAMPVLGEMLDKAEGNRKGSSRRM